MIEYTCHCIKCGRNLDDTLKLYGFGYCKTCGDQMRYTVTEKNTEDTI